MRSGKLIDISKSSLISLKAELTRKQEEVKKVKEHESYVKLPPKPKKEVKSNPGVERRNEKDIELTKEEIDLLKKSREVLEIKSTIYDKYQKGELVPSDGKSHYLVDFDRKSPEPSTSHTLTDEKVTVSDDLNVNINVKDDSENKDGESENIDEDEWVEYTDCLGRSRSCHRSDLSVMRNRDKSLATQLNVGSGTSKDLDGKEDMSKDNFSEGRELLSRDMHLEELRKKWEEQEGKLSNKQDVHYEDLLFDEARSHGVGYWAFSTDADKRAAEQEMFKKVRMETEKRQKEAAALRMRRDEQRQARLIAARERQRVRLGLPPISAEDIKSAEADDEGSSEKNIEDHKREDENTEDLQRKLLRAAHVRPWDVGKDGVKEPVMTQEEWIEKKRAERNEEFAPIPTSPPKTNINVFKTANILPKKKLLSKERKGNVASCYNPTPLSKNKETASFMRRNEAIHGEGRGVGVEIPPPLGMDTQGLGNKRKANSIVDTAAAIEAGLKYLREEHEKTSNAPTRGAYNMI